MAAHLGLSISEVHDAADEVLDFWFGALTPDQWFERDEAVDRACRARFESLREQVLATRATGWRDEPETLLAAIILLDQISRNIYRGSPRAYEADDCAEALSKEAVARGWVREFPADHAQFMLMPLQHAEDPDAQALSVQQFAKLDDPDALDFARDHKEVIDRFGRFPSRNAVLGRISTPEEEDYLNQPRAGWAA